MRILACTILVLVATSLDAQVVKKVNILFVFDNAARSSIVDKSAYVQDLMNGVRARFVANGLPQLMFVHQVDGSNINYSGSNKSGKQAVSHLQTSQVVADKRGANDLVIMISKTWNENACGRASPIPASVYAFDNSEVSAFAAIQKDGCEDVMAIVLTHEIGHLLFGEHQVERNQNGQVILSVDDNSDATKPATYNHGYDGGSSGTLMADPVGLNYTLATFSNGTGAQDPFWENVKKMFGSGLPFDGSWNVVANYRNPASPPPACTITVVQNPCDPFSTYPSFTIGAQLPGYTYDASLIQNETAFGWQDYYQGPPACVIFETFGLQSIIRVLLNTATGISQCTFTIPAPSLCGGGFP